MALKSLTALKQRFNSTKEEIDNAQFADLLDAIFVSTRRQSRTLVSLIAVATVNLLVVPDDYDFYLVDTFVEGSIAQSGGTSSTMKIGTSGSLNLLNETSGHGFVAATATTLLPAGKRRSMTALYPLSNMNGSTVTKIAAGSTIVADVSGTVLTAGAVFVELHGYFVPKGIET